jgi:predicted ester cyclase
MNAQVDQAAANKAIVHKFVELFMEGKWEETFPQVIAEDCVIHYPGGRDVVGLKAIIENWVVAFGTMKDMDWTSHVQISEGDILVEFLTWRYKYEGEYMGKQLSGKPVEMNQVEIIRIEDGKIKEWWIEQDQLHMARQLGMELQW